MQKPGQYEEREFTLWWPWNVTVCQKQQGWPDSVRSV